MHKVLYTFFMFLGVFGILTPLSVYAQNNNQGDVIVQTIPGPSVAEKATNRAKSSWAWYLTRGSGIVAAIALVILMLSGIGLVTGYTFKFLEPITAWASHRTLGIALGVSVFIHVFSLLFDNFLKFNIIDLVIPWVSNYRRISIFGFNVGSLYIALGILALYLLAAIIISSLLWVDKKPHTWKIIHILSYIVIGFVFFHALFIGTDLAHGIFRWIWILLGAGLVAAIIHRLWRSYTL